MNMPTFASDLSSDNANWWEQALPLHLDSAFYDVAGFLADPDRLTIGTEEREWLSQIAGQRLLHVQCAFGLDSLSWARLGAIVTGVDRSPAAIDAAGRLARESGLHAEFVCHDAMALDRLALPVFDAAYASYGVIDWISDLDVYFRGIRKSLRTGGRFVLAEVHPVAKWMLRQAGNAGAIYAQRELPARLDGVSYAGGTVDAQHWAWSWSMADVLSAMARQGFRIECMCESASTSYRFHRGLVTDASGRWHWPKLPHGAPLIFAVMAMAE